LLSSFFSLETSAAANIQEEYFKRVLQSHSDNNIVKNLATKGITPSDVKSYMAKDLKSALYSFESNANVDILLACQDINGKQYISSIYTCLDKNYRTIKCPCPVTPSRDEHVCRDNQPVYYPTFKVVGV